MSRGFALAYGLFAYVLFLGSFIALIAFIADVFLPRTIDRGPAASWGAALAIDVALIAAFGIQHSVMARAWIKRAIERSFPATIERSTYVLASVAAVAALLLLWRPIPHVLWHADGWVAQALIALYAFGIVLVLVSTFAIDHFELFGVAQVVAFARGREHRPPAFRLSPLYRVVRHPLYVGWFIMFFAAPTMTVGHLVFACGMGAYILVGIRYEERGLVAAHGAEYEEYRARVPMLVPRLPFTRRRGD